MWGVRWGLDRTWGKEIVRHKGCSRTFMFHRTWPARAGEEGLEKGVKKEFHRELGRITEGQWWQPVDSQTADRSTPEKCAWSPASPAQALIRALR